MSKLEDGSSRYLAEEIEALPWLGDGDDLMRILHVDERMRQVVFIQRFARNTTHMCHTHHCTAFAYTLSGCWAYDGEPFPTGTVAYEPFGSRHTPMTRNDNVAEVLVILTAAHDSDRMLELEVPEGGRIELDLPAFKRLSMMKSNDEWPAFAADLVARMTPA